MYQILTLLAALPFKWINDVVETFGSIFNLLFPDQAEEEDGDEEMEQIALPQYPDPVEVKGFHQHNNEETEESQ